MSDMLQKGIDDEEVAQIQSFTSFMAKRGYHVIGALISRDKSQPRTNVRVFSTAPEGRDKQISNMKGLVTILHAVVTGKLGSESGEAFELPIEEN